MYSSTLGDTTTRVVEKEESYVIAQGFPVASGQTVYNNMMVKLNTDGTVQDAAASTARPIGRVVSASDKVDKGNCRVATPFESIVHAKASGTVDENDKLAYAGYDTTTSRPIFKTAATGDFICAIALTGGATTTDVTVGILRVPALVVV